MVQDNYQPVNGETDDGVFSSGVSVGALLKDEREKKGLTHARISEQTRLRPHVLKALENEDWEKLRGPTLVKGFIRSYAKALGLDAERILAVYEEEVPEQSFADRFVFPSIEKRRRWPVFLLLAVVLMAGAAGYYLWTEYNRPGEKGLSPKTPAVTEREKEKTAPVLRPKDASTADVLAQHAATLMQTPDEAEIPVRNKTDESAPENQLISPEMSAASVEVQEIPLEKEDAASPDEKPPLLLTGHITERTWVRIVIDGGDPKEYILKPGDCPQWSARTSFELLIGNAGGITLEFDGKKMDNLGRQGQVVRIKLPPEDEKVKVKE